MMNKIITRRFVGYTLALLLLFVAIAPSAIAKHKPETLADSVTVVAHLPLARASVSQIFLQGHGDKQYLYIQQASEEGFTIVDVTKPNRPNVVNRVKLSNKASGETLQMVGVGLAIAQAPGAAGTESARNNLTPAKGEGTLGGGTGGDQAQFVRLLDLNDPANPRTLQTFDTVSSILLDDGQNLIYITNSEGLWILRHNVPPPHPLCDSETTDDTTCFAD
jgi:hypothetical protein